MRTLDNMHRRRFGLVALMALAFALTDIALGDSSGSFKLLRELRDGLKAARALPKGSRPHHPDVELNNLIGLGKNDVRRYLHDPSYCGNDDSLNDPDADCETSPSWSYSWGPPPPELRSGPGWIEVSAGGPWLLVLGFTDNHVNAVRWQGQR